MEAVILAGGQGRRLTPVFSGPKCLVPVRGRPLLAHVIGYLRSYGVTRILVAAGHLGGEVHEYVRHTCDDTVDVVIEPRPLGTAGALVPLLPRLSSHFLVVNGDTLLAGDLSAMWQYHLSAACHITLGVVKKAGADYGRVTASAIPGPIMTYEQNVSESEQDAGYASAGVYAVSRDALLTGPLRFPLSLERDVLPHWVSLGKVDAFGLDAMMDVGTPERLKEAMDRWLPLIPVQRA
jgi:NDP-sugar pyrophosphorylase family protein